VKSALATSLGSHSSYNNLYQHATRPGLLDIGKALSILTRTLHEAPVPNLHEAPVPNLPQQKSKDRVMCVCACVCVCYVLAVLLTYIDRPATW